MIQVLKGQLLEFQLQRNYIGIKVRRLRIMPVTDLHTAQLSRDPLGRRDPETGAKEIAGKFRQRIITGIVTVALHMLLIRRKIIHGRLRIIAVER